MCYRVKYTKNVYLYILFIYYLCEEWVIHKILLIIPPQEGDDIMSTQENVERLLALRNQILKNLNDFTVKRSDYQNEGNRLAAVDQELAFYGL